MKLKNVGIEKTFTLKQGMFSTGSHSVQFDAGDELSSGIYFCRLTTQKFSQTIKMTLIK